MNELKQGAFTNDDEFFKSTKITEGGNLVKAFRGQHKYIKRTGTPMHYKYWYKDSKGKLVEGVKPNKLHEIEKKMSIISNKLEQNPEYSKDLEQEYEKLRIKRDEIAKTETNDSSGAIIEGKAPKEDKGEQKNNNLNEFRSWLNRFYSIDYDESEKKYITQDGDKYTEKEMKNSMLYEEFVEGKNIKDDIAQDKISPNERYYKKLIEHASNLEQKEKEKQKTILQKDMEAAEKIKSDIGDAYKKISDTLKKIDSSLSKFNSPGLRSAFVDSIKKALSAQGFNDTVAINELTKYFSRK